MHPRRVRLADVAEAAGVSRTTVSFVLNGRTAGIPAATRQRVSEVAARLGYHPNAAARALATGRTQRLGIVLNQPESFGRGDTYFTELLAGVTAGTLKRNHNLLLYCARYPDWSALRADILSGAADGVLLVGRFASDELTHALLEYGLPTVCLSFHVDHPACCSVDCNNLQGGRLAAWHLCSLGHRRIAFLYPGDEVSWGAERHAGALQALAEAGLAPECLLPLAWEETGVPDAGWVREAVRFLVAERPTAAVCCDEVRALGVVEALQASGVRVPEDCSFISFNSTELSRRAHPPMTSVWQPLRAVGEQGVELLVDLIERREVGEQQIQLPVRLDVRQSCAEPGPPGWPPPSARSASPRPA